MRYSVLLYFLAAIPSVLSIRRLYNFSLYKVTAFNVHERTILYSFYMENYNIVFFNGVTNDAALPMDIFIHRCCTREFEIVLQLYSIEYERIHEDLWQNELSNSNNDRDLWGANSKTAINVSARFLSYSSMYVWASGMTRQYPDLKLILLDKTYESRYVFILKLTKGENRPAVFILGGEQGRDWASPSIIINFITTMMENQDEFEPLTSLYDFYFLPLFNPDGYQYSMTVDRLWNRNRKIFTPQRICPNNRTGIGVNIDRNWFYDATSNSMNEECDAVYIGAKPLSEKESQTVSEFLNSIAFKMMAFINLRSFGNIVTVPYAKSEDLSHNYNIVKEIVLYAIKKVKASYNVTFKLCNTGSCFFNYTGNIPDWVKKKLNIPVVLTIHLTTENSFFPTVKCIPSLTNEFNIFITETLTLANSIYGPLFNAQIDVLIDNNLIIVLIVSSLLI